MEKKHAKHALGLAGLLVAVALTLASCGGAGGGSASPSAENAPQDRAQNGGHGPAGDHGEEGAGHSPRQGTGGGGTVGTDHSEMDHGSMGGEKMARRMLEDGDRNYSDRRFIDTMVPHHEGAVEMAEVALENSEREEILDLSRDIVRAQETEIEELKDIKRDEFGTAEIPAGMGGGEMRMMGMMDPDELARRRPFDKAFMDAMIPHHESAIDMANVALKESENPRLRELATDIVDAQEREIAQMKEWRGEWYPAS